MGPDGSMTRPSTLESLSQVSAMNFETWQELSLSVEAVDEAFDNGRGWNETAAG
jgi:hypothetical protein